MGDFHIGDHLRVDRVNSVDFCQLLFWENESDNRAMQSAII